MSNQKEKIKKDWTRIRFQITIVIGALAIILTIISNGYKYYKERQFVAEHPIVVDSSNVPGLDGTPQPVSQTSQSNPILQKKAFFKASKEFDAFSFDDVIATLGSQINSGSNVYRDSEIYSYSYLMMGVSYFKSEKNHDLVKAIKYLKLYLAQQSHTKYSAIAWSFMAKAYLQSKNIAEATAIVSKITKQPECRSEDFALAGNVYLEADDYKKALEFFKMAVTKDSKNYYAYLGMFSADIALYDLSGAKSALESARAAYTAKLKTDLVFEEKLKRNQALLDKRMKN